MSDDKYREPEWAYHQPLPWELEAAHERVREALKVGDDEAYQLAGEQLKALLKPTLAAHMAGRGNAPGLTWRTLADVSDAPPADLLLGMAEPAGPTLIYGDGGVGKGCTAAWITHELHATHNIRTMIFDAEGHPSEWRRRVSGLGTDPSRIVYVQQHELPAHLIGQPLHEMAGHLVDVARASGCGMLIVDSILAASNLGMDGLRLDVRSPYQYMGRLTDAGLPSISIAHVPKGSAGSASSQPMPYGSVAWTNASRLVWYGSKAEGDNRTRWTVTKKNDRGAVPAFVLAFTFADGRLVRVEREDDERATRYWLEAQLAAGPATVEELADALLAETDGAVDGALMSRTKDRLRVGLNRMKRQARAHKSGGRGGKWALGDPRSQRRTNGGA